MLEEFMKNRMDNFIELYFEAIEENIDAVIAQLEEEGIDTEQSQQDILRLIQKKKAEIKLGEGKKFKQFYLQATQSKNTKQENGISGSKHMLAARKQTNVFSAEEQKDILSDEEKLEIIKKLTDEHMKPHP